MCIIDWSSDVCSSDLGERWIGLVACPAADDTSREDPVITHWVEFPSFPSFPQLPSKKIEAETLPQSTWQPAEPTHLLRYPVHLRAAHCGPCPFPLQRKHENPPCTTNIPCPCCWRLRSSRRPRRTPPPPTDRKSTRLNP